MKKILLLFCFILLIGSGVAYSGVSPSSYQRDFKPHFKESFLFNFILSEGVFVDIVVEGDLAEYVKLDKKNLEGSGSVIALLELPEEIDVPGVHKIFVRANQVVEAEEGVVIALNVGGVIVIRVPYPGKYAELDLKTKNVNRGEPVDLDLIVYSRGDEDISASAEINHRPWK